MGYSHIIKISFPVAVEKPNIKKRDAVEYYALLYQWKQQKKAFKNDRNGFYYSQKAEMKSLDSKIKCQTDRFLPVINWLVTYDKRTVLELFLERPQFCSLEFQGVASAFCFPEALSSISLLSIAGVFFSIE